MNTEQLINAVRNATGGTFLPEYGTTTLLGWMQEYDELGRPLYADPNTTTGDIRIAGTVSDRLVWGPCTVTVGSGYPLGVSYVSCDQACNHDDVEIPAQTITIEAGKTEYNLGQANFRLCE